MFDKQASFSAFSVHTVHYFNPSMQQPGFFRHLAIICYDFILLIAVLFLSTAIALPFNQGEAITPEHPAFIFYGLYLIGVIYFYYVGFWLKGGTLGMKTWKVTLQSLDHRPLTWQQASLRFITALLSCGLGLFWSMIDKKHLTWHDRISKTCLVRQTTSKT